MFSATALTQVEETITEKLDRCRDLTNAMARLGCYDRIGEPRAASQPAPKNHVDTETGLDAAPDSELVRDDSASPAPKASEGAFEDTEYGELTDNIGLPKSADAYKPISVTIANCGKTNNRKWYFYFDNGQVWQYIGARSLRYRRCNTPAILEEDTLGFVLHMEGDTARLRVKRVR